MAAIIAFYKEKHRRMGGGWIANRYLYNQGVPFELAYEIAIGKPCPERLK